MTNHFQTIGITGAGGNVGQTLQRGLADHYQLKLYDRQVIRPVKTGESFQVDLGKEEKLADLFQGLDALIHLAGDPRPNAPAVSTQYNNFVTTSYVFEAAKQAGVKKVIFASSNFYHEGAIQAILRGNSRQKILLTDNPTPLSLYGKSKVFGENLGLHLTHFGLQFVALRIGWTVPEDNPALYGGLYMRSVFCSQRDLIQYFSQALVIQKDFVVAFAVSNNQKGIFDLTETCEQLKIMPQDDAEAYF